MTWTPLLLVLGFSLGAQPAPACKAKTATECYQEFLAARDKATSLDDLAGFMTKEAREGMELAPPEMRKEALEVMKDAAPRKIRVVKETVTAKGAVLVLEGVSGPQDARKAGQAVLTKDRSGWHVDKETWDESGR